MLLTDGEEYPRVYLPAYATGDLSPTRVEALGWLVLQQGGPSFSWWLRGVAFGVPEQELQRNAYVWRPYLLTPEKHQQLEQCLGKVDPYATHR